MTTRSTCIITCALLASAAGCALDDKDSPPAGVPFAITYVCNLDGRYENEASAALVNIGLVVNRSEDRPLDLAKLVVGATTDDDARVDVELWMGDLDGLLPPGHATGQLTEFSWRLLQPWTPEPLDGGRGPYLGFSVEFLQPAPHLFDATIHAAATVVYDDQVATLPFVVTVRSTGPLDVASTEVCRATSATAE